MDVWLKVIGWIVLIALIWGAVRFFRWYNRLAATRYIKPG